MHIIIGSLELYGNQGWISSTLVIKDGDAPPDGYYVACEPNHTSMFSLYSLK